MGELKTYVGIDWGAQEHQVHVLSAKAEESNRIAHSGAAIQKLVARLAALQEDPSKIGVAIETKSGPLVEALLERGFSVFSLNPKQLDRFRDRHSVAGAKDDRLDAYVLAQSLKTDRTCFQKVRAAESELVELRSVNRELEGLKKDRRRKANVLRDRLWRYYPQILELCPGADEAWIWDLLEVAPTPAQGMSLNRADVAQILRTRRIKRVDAKHVVKLLRTPPLRVAPGVVEGATGNVRRLVRQLRMLHEQIGEVEGELKALLKRLSHAEPSAEGPGQREHRDAEIVLSFPGAGTNLTATLLAEATDAIATRDYLRLRALCGVAPVRRSSGKQDSRYRRYRAPAVMRRARSQRLLQAVHWWAFSAIRCDVAARRQYDALRAKGHSQARALRGVGDRLLRILVAALHAGALYDPSRLTGTYANAA